jgi:hypothetical protein
MENKKGIYMIDWERLEKYPMGHLEKKIAQLLFEDYVNPKNNSGFEDMSQPEFDSHFNMFMVGWKLANISLDLDKSQEIAS